jgi:predicted dehydrogenase
MIRYFFGEPTGVRSLVRRMYSASVEDFASVHMEFPSGVVGHAEIGWSFRNYNPDEFLLEIHGDVGSLSVTRDRLIVYGGVGAQGTSSLILLPAHQLDPQVPILLGGVDNVAQDLAFLQHVAAGTQPGANFESSALTSKLIDLVLESVGGDGGG